MQSSEHIEPSEAINTHVYKSSSYPSIFFPSPNEHTQLFVSLPSFHCPQNRNSAGKGQTTAEVLKQSQQIDRDSWFLTPSQPWRLYQGDSHSSLHDISHKVMMRPDTVNGAGRVCLKMHSDTQLHLKWVWRKNAWGDGGGSIGRALGWRLYEINDPRFKPRREHRIQAPCLHTHAQEWSRTLAKDPVVHVRGRWITETRKDPACTLLLTDALIYFCTVDKR